MANKFLFVLRYLQWFLLIFFCKVIIQGTSCGIIEVVLTEQFKDAESLSEWIKNEYGLA